MKYIILLIIFLNIIYSSSYKINGNKINGVNLGGWMLLEPWITPTMFYSSLGLKNKFPIDMYTFCDYYEPNEANNKLRLHWDNWVKEEDIKKLSDNKINLLRVPIGDWMYEPYGPYAKEKNGLKCTDGSIEKIDWLFGIASKYNLKVLLDLHGVKNSQNGFDNSGQSLNLNITENNFIHWDIRTANWVGKFNLETKQYESIDMNSIDNTIKILEKIIIKYSNTVQYPNLYGIAILNEPWEYTPELILKDFYQKTFNIFTTHMDSTKVYIFHDSFRNNIWTNFELYGNNKLHPILIDTHQYTAWNSPYDSYEHLIKSNYGWEAPLAKYPYLVGEFSLAIDNCEMWLNGFMDNIQGFPQYLCSYEKCPKLDEGTNKEYIKKAINGPWGTGISYPDPDTFECPITINFTNHFATNIKFENIKEYQLAKEVFESKIKSYEKYSAGWIYWNFKTDSASYQWDYLKLTDLLNEYNKSIQLGTISNPIEATKTFFYNYIFYFCLIFIIGIISTIYYIQLQYKLYKKRNTYYEVLPLNEVLPLTKNEPKPLYYQKSTYFNV